jgi:hypothetical protein
MPRTLCGGQGRSGGWQERLSGRGRAHTAGEALQQRAADLPLKGANLLGERGLRDVQGRSRAGERPFVDNCDQVLELAQCYRGSLRDTSK